MKNRGQWIAVSVILGMLAFALSAALLLSPEITRIEPGSDAPAFSAVDVFTGDTVAFESFRGDVVLLNIWATWCAPCEAEMPSIQRLHDALQDDGLQVVAVSVDQDDPAVVRRWIEERDLNFTVLHDRHRRIEQIYQTTGQPESFVIDRRGIIVKKIIGATEWDHPAQQALFRRLLGSE